jgi:hypothetical protein
MIQENVESLSLRRKTKLLKSFKNVIGDLLLGGRACDVGLFGQL